MIRSDSLALGERLSSRLNSASSGVGFVEYATATKWALPERRVPPQRANSLIHDFHRILVETWLAGRWPAELVAPVWAPPFPLDLLRDVDPSWLVPTFVRTDESATGAIFEIQCPGGWWGTVDALELEVGSESTLAERVAAELEALQPDGVRVLHLFDSAGLWHENVYFAHRLRAVSDRITVCGLDPDTWPAEATFVRAHAFRPLIAEDRFVERIKGLAAGWLRFDHPPLPIFDQKLPLCLPFHPSTKSWFTDEHRLLFPFTAPVVNGRVAIEDDREITLEELARSGHRSTPGWFLKYAGTDPTRNHSAAAVHALGGLDAGEWAEVKDLIAADAARGEPWLVQESVDTLASDEPDVSDGTSHVKVSIFHGPRSALGGVFLECPEVTVHGGGAALVGLLTGWDC